MNSNGNDIPEVAGEIPEDPSVVGSLDPQEMATLADLRQQGNQITMEIGSMEIRKARLLGNLSQLEEHAQHVLNGAGDRCGISKDTSWQVTPDGKIHVLGRHDG